MEASLMFMPTTHPRYVSLNDPEIEREVNFKRSAYRSPLEVLIRLEEQGRYFFGVPRRLPKEPSFIRLWNPNQVKLP